MYEAALATGLEGVIAKRKASMYVPGVRSTYWLKIKPTKTAKLLIVGYLRNRTGLTSLLVGYRHHGTLVYAGRVSSGLTMKRCDQLLAVLQQSPPGKPLPTRAEALWVEPARVAAVSYYERTQQRKLRHPVFVGLRDDVDPADINQ
jgi:bifunctional non-homologous end joining protein LigD